VIGNIIRIYVHEMEEKDWKPKKDELEVPLPVQDLKPALPRVAVTG